MTAAVLERVEAPAEPVKAGISIPKLAWMAGVIDMKGRTRRVIHISRRNPLYILQVETSNLVVARQLCKLTGTRVEYSEAKILEVRSRRGCAEHCPEPHQHVTPVLPKVGRWHISGAGAAIVLHNLMPYFGGETGNLKQFCVDVFDNLPLGGRGRHAVDQSIKRLSGLGWDVSPLVKQA